MRADILERLTQGQTMSGLQEHLHGSEVSGRPLVVTVDYRARPYLDHIVAGWTDGPPGSNVAVVISGASPDGVHWRRFTVSREGPWAYEIDVFPTPFNNPEAPLAPGIPPGASRRFS